jgi:uncharacterized membrane protein
MAGVSHPEQYPIRKLPLSRPLLWLSAAWLDLFAHPLASLFYGALVAGLGTLMLAYFSHPYLLAGAITGFMLFGPAMTAGLCALSSARERGEDDSLSASLASLRRNRRGLLQYAAALALITALWFGLSAMLLQVMLGAAPAVGESLLGGTLHHLRQEQLLAYITTGGLLAMLVLCVSVVAVPMLTDRHVDARTAMETSARVTLRDFPVVLVWGALITLLIALCFITHMLALLVVFPLLGHATWRAYRELLIE